MKNIYYQKIIVALLVLLIIISSNPYKSNTSDCPKYDLTKYIQPYWSNNIIYNESVMALKNEDGSLSPIQLLYPADKIISIRDSRLATVYTQGKDYKLENGKVIILPNSTIPKMPYNSYYPTKQSDLTMPKTGGGYIAFGEGDTFIKRQIAVTYIHTKSWTGPIPQFKGNLLPKTLKKLENKEPVKILFYGDSITTGANSSGFIKEAPYAPNWCDMTAEALKAKYSDNSISLVNTAVGGTTSSWGAQNAQTLASDKKPDLAIIAFGMNDGSSRVNSEDFKNNINTIIQIIHRDNLNCEFIVVAPLLPNPESPQNGLQRTYLPALKQLEKVGVAMVNITELHSELLKHKHYYDMTGNNVNHPNDFLARLYSQAMLATLIHN